MGLNLVGMGINGKTHNRYVLGTGFIHPAPALLKIYFLYYYFIFFSLKKLEIKLRSFKERKNIFKHPPTVVL